MHIYDASSLQVIRHAQAHTDSVYGQVVIDEAAASERRFQLLDIGSRVRVLSVKPSTHTDKFGGTSSSLLADVIGVGVLEPETVLAKMPFMTIECADDDALCVAPADTPADTAAWASKLAEAAALCESLETVTSYKGPLSVASEQGADGEWSLGNCTDRVLALREGDDVSDGSRLRLFALASTVHLPGEMRLRAMELAQRGELTELVTSVEEALQAEGRRRLALKALSGLSEPSPDDDEGR